ncbi:hypothetical protein KI387_024540 [Taxus chinensis]|uniref:Protein kinase domain-containing protein n=1 Tax=Taxus chinensis TaxID=29808 RepID=A0AA38G610_TAXCH|nr:hypothetical protein KI387_024540 [Taxus chinensis]
MHSFLMTKESARFLAVDKHEREKLSLLSAQAKEEEDIVAAKVEELLDISMRKTRDVEGKTILQVVLEAWGDHLYIVKDLLGQGTFGQVVKCWSNVTNSFVAVKVIKNQPAYYHQALVEVSVLTTLNKKFDPEDKHHIVRMHDNFVFHGHLCIVFEMLGANLYELIKTNQFRGVSLNLLKLFAKQILDSLLVLRDASVIHCDLKPENILLTPSIHSAEIKLIDFGSACMENQTIYSYIQSRFYRSPEVVLGHPYTATIDMWSFGCIAAELFLGLPLFPGDSEYDLMKRMIERLGGQPPDHILRTARNSSKYFNHVGNAFVDESLAAKGVKSAYQFLSESEYEAREKKKPASGKRYFNYVRLEDIIFNYPHRKKMTKEELAKENQIRLSFVDFLRGLVHFDPVKRWTPRQAAQHPFVTEEPFSGPYRPFPEAPHMHVFHEIMVDVNPGSSRWSHTSLIPQVVNTNASSPQYHPTKFNHTSSYGSLGSYCIRGEGFGLANNCGCQGDTQIPVIYRPQDAFTVDCQEDGVPGVNCLGESPKTWHRTMRVSHEHALGDGMFRPMSFGVSPSQIPSSFQVHLSSGSHGKQDPTSSASGDIHGTALGRAAAVRPYHKTRGLGVLGNVRLSCEEEIFSQCQVDHQSYDSGERRYVFV